MKEPEEHAKAVGHEHSGQASRWGTERGREQILQKVEG